MELTENLRAIAGRFNSLSADRREALLTAVLRNDRVKIKAALNNGGEEHRFVRVLLSATESGRPEESNKQKRAPMTK